MNQLYSMRKTTLLAISLLCAGILSSCGELIYDPYPVNAYYCPDIRYTPPPLPPPHRRAPPPPPPRRYYNHHSHPRR